jgi:hypothetical protein
VDVLGRIRKETVGTSVEELSSYLTGGTKESNENLQNASVEHYRHANPLNLPGHFMAAEAMSFGESGGEHLENVFTG